MRLKEVEQGDGLFWRFAILMISFMSRSRLPDAARIVFYHRSFYGKIVSEWTQATMRGESSWSVGERELMAAMIAKWNSCDFCIGAHTAIAKHALGIEIVNSTVNDSTYESTSVTLKDTLGFLEVLTKNPENVTSQMVQKVLDEGVSTEALEDAIAVAVLFNITVRIADTLDFLVLSDKQFEQSGRTMLKRGYGGKKNPSHPDHKLFAKELENTIFSEHGVSDLKLRKAMSLRAVVGEPLTEPYETLALQMGKNAYKITDSQVANVLKATGSEKKTFELIIASAVGVGLYMWKIASKALEEARTF